ncbi:hypothetical protein [Kineobactrum salinum]|uniref:hypothetical protein n=1 Tax=Kineobactrum salinum TaxID=2708301 RepID=UPI0018D9A655|nr:hypothetical protein [Kineobactrum salinum]
MGTHLIASASVAALLTSPLSVMAQTSTEAPDSERQRDRAQLALEGQGLEEVIVTATRRSQPLQDVPLSVTALSQEELTAKGIVGYEGWRKKLRVSC